VAGEDRTPGPADRAKGRAALRRVEKLAYWLDDRYRLPGTRFRIGFDGIIGLIPGIGDAITSMLAGYIVYEAWRLGIPAATLLRMVANLGIDAVVGIVPLVGDLLDFGFKANRRNLRLLLRYLAERGAFGPAAVVPVAPARSRPS
jgi:Domain of unknown function (DUF4112)